MLIKLTPGEKKIVLMKDFEKKTDQINRMLQVHFRRKPTFDIISFFVYLFVCLFVFFCLFVCLFVCRGRPSSLIQRESQSHQSNANSVNKITNYKRTDLRQRCCNSFFAQLLNEWNEVWKCVKRVYFRFRGYLGKSSEMIIFGFALWTTLRVNQETNNDMNNGCGFVNSKM